MQEAEKEANLKSYNVYSKISVLNHFFNIIAVTEKMNTKKRETCNKSHLKLVTTFYKDRAHIFQVCPKT